MIGERVSHLPPEMQVEVLDFVEFIGQRSLDMGAVWDKDVAQRINEVDAGRVEGIPAGQVLQELRKMYG